MKKKIRKLKVKKLGILSDAQMSILLGGGDLPNGDLTLPPKPSDPTNCLPPPAGATHHPSNYCNRSPHLPSFQRGFGRLFVYLPTR